MPLNDTFSLSWLEAFPIVIHAVSINSKKWLSETLRAKCMISGVVQYQPKGRRSSEAADSFD